MKTIFMRRADGEAWLAALRSGEYKQGRGTLYDRNSSSYCCLGVLQKAVCREVEALDLPSKK